MTTTTPLLRTPLYDTHVARKAKLVPFGGYSLPVWFSSLKDEHTAVRTRAGMFDISHMGVLIISGIGTFEFLQRLSCNDLTGSLSGKMVYSMLLNEQGGILDDIMVGYLDSKFYMVVNASNKAKISTWLGRHKPDQISIVDQSPAYGFIAIQGPQAIERIQSVYPQTIPPRFSLFTMILEGHLCIAMRTGYTGEDGLELILPSELMPPIWDKLCESGITPCGLGARDTLRLEAGLPLYGQELSENITPLMTRYAWVVKFKKDFIGKEALLEQQKAALPLVTVGIEMCERVIARSHYRIVEGGEVTSGTLSPSLDKPIAMALVKPEFSALGTSVHVEIRGIAHQARVVEVPFR